MSPFGVCAVTTRRFPAGPARQLLQPEATEAVMDVVRPPTSGNDAMGHTRKASSARVTCAYLPGADIGRHVCYVPPADIYAHLLPMSKRPPQKVVSPLRHYRIRRDERCSSVADRLGLQSTRSQAAALPRWRVPERPQWCLAKTQMSAYPLQRREGYASA